MKCRNLARFCFSGAVLAALLFCYKDFQSKAEETFEVEDSVLVSIPDGVSEVKIPSDVTAFDVDFSGRKIDKIFCDHELEYFNLDAEDCSFGTIDVAATEISLSVTGDSQISNLNLTSQEEYSEANVEITGSTVSAVTFDVEDVTAALDCKFVTTLALGDFNRYASIEGRAMEESTALRIGELRLGEVLESLQIARIYSIDDIKNRSSAFQIEDGLIYSLQDYSDMDCLESGVLGSECALVFYPLEKTDLEGIIDDCDMLGNYVFDGHDFGGSVKIPKGIRIVGYHSFSNLPNKTEIEFPSTLDFLDDEIVYGSSGILSFNEKKPVFASPLAFSGFSTLELEIPVELQFVYYTYSDTQLADKLSAVSTDIVTFKASRDSKAANVLELAGVPVEWSGEETVSSVTEISGLTIKKTGVNKLKVTWDAVEGAGHYDIEYGKKKSLKNSIVITRLKNSCVLSGLKKGKTYYVRVRAASGEVNWSWSKKVKKKV